MKRLRRTSSFAALALSAGFVVAGCGNDDPGATVEASPTVANVGNLPESRAETAAASVRPAVVELPGGTLPPDGTDAALSADTPGDESTAAASESDEAAASSVAGTSAAESTDLDSCSPASTPTDSAVAESSVAESSVAESSVAESSVADDCPPTATDDVDETDVDETDVDETDVDETDVDDTDVDETDVDETDVDDTDVDETDVDETDGGRERPSGLASPRDRWEAFADDADPETFAGGADAADLVESNRVLMIGDSVMASTSSRYGGEACNQLEPQGWAVEVDAETGRFIDFGMRVLEQRVDADFDVAVVMLGNNYGANPEVFEDGLRDIVDELVDANDEMPIVLYTVSMYRPDRVEVNDIVYEIAAEHDNIRVIDWETETTEDTSLTGGDGLHLSDSGRARMIELLADELGDAPDGSDGDCLDSDFTDDSATSGTGTTLPGQAPYTNPPQWTPPSPTQPQWTNPPQTTPQTPAPTQPEPTTGETPAPPPPTDPQPTTGDTPAPPVPTPAPTPVTPTPTAPAENAVVPGPGGD